MGPGSGRKVINLEGGDGEFDERTERRLRRRGIANGIYNPNLRRSTPKKSRKCNAQVENLMLDKDYEKYLSLIQRGRELNEHSSDHGINGDCENEHNDDGNEHRTGENNDIRSVDGDGNKHSVDDNNDARVVDGSGSEHSVDDTVNLKSVDHSGGRNGRCGVDDGDGGNAHFGDANIHVNSLNHGVNDDDMDPQYKIFWDNLKEDGNSYVLEMVQEDGRVKQIRYHQGDGLPDELDLDATHSQGKQKTEFKNRETMENLEDAPEKRFSVKKKKNVKLEALEPISDGTNVCSSKRPRLEVPNTPKSLGSSPQKEKTETRKNSRSVIKKRNLEDRPEKKNGLEKKSSMLKKNVKEADADPLSGRTNGRSHKQSGSKYLRFSEGGCNSEAESDSNLTDDSYQEFLSCTKDDGKVMVFTSRICGPLIYDSDEESSSDSDVIVLDRDPHEGYRTPIKIDVDSRRSTESHSQFRQGIMQDLKRPYHLEEYINLLEDWSCQRPATGHDRNLRNGNVKSYALPGEFGKSYQEMYKDLAGKINAVTGDDRPRKLNLLRGFFYWLKNISQEGSFKPWNDKACLKVVPQTLNRRTS